VSINRHESGEEKAREIEEQIETRSGHPTSAGQDAESAGTGRDLGAEFFGASPRANQHARKGQAESPRELTQNQPEKKREGHR